MNRIEKTIYDLVKRYPRLKLLIRNLYQAIFDLCPDRPSWFKHPVVVKEDFFWGFHDVTQFSCDENYMLANKLTIPLRMPTEKDELTVGYWDKQLTEFTPVDSTLAWNYHKGCRLQWVGSDSKAFIYNVFESDRLASRIYSLETGISRRIEAPIDTVSKDGRYATSFSYYRLNALMPGYGYLHKDDHYLEEAHPAATGLFLLKLSDGKKALLISLETLSRLAPEKSMEGARHYVTHTAFSPDNQYVAFLHRWTHTYTVKRYTRLITCRLDGSDLHISPTTDMVSHYVWEKEGLLAYCRINGTDAHYLFTDHTLRVYRQLAPALNSDGHQHFVPGTSLFVTDTYPDKRRYARLFLVDYTTNEVEKIADVKSYKKFQSKSADKHWACDLHPRVSPRGTYLTFDSVHTGRRGLCVMKLKK